MDERIIEARKEYKTVSEANFEGKQNFIDDMKFAHGIDSGQWDESDIDDRQKTGRPYLSSNKMAKFVAQVVNQERGQPERDKVIPVDDQGDPKIADILNDIILDIEYQSEADEVYSLAGEHAVSGGFGYWRIVTEYSDEAFDQEIKLKPIYNPLLVDIDPKRNYAFIREGLSIEEFRQKYPGKKYSDFEPAEDNELWYEDDKIFVGERYKKVPKDKIIAEVDTGGKRIVIELDDEIERKIKKKKWKILRDRPVKSHEVKWIKMTGEQILDEGDWAGKEIPIIEVVGHAIHLEGNVYKKSLIRDARDPQRMYNYWLTSMTEKVALAPKAPYLVTAQQISGFEKEWENANIDNPSYLLYNPSGEGRPQRMESPAIDQGAMSLLSIANTDINDVLGRYEASVGQASNERSGKAILARAARSDLSTFNFPDNLRRAKVQTKKQLIDIIPKYYDNERVIRLRNEETPIRINYEALDGTIIHDLSQGRYDIRFNIQGHPSRRQQIVEFIRELLQYSPPEYHDILLQLAIQYADIEGADEVLQAIKQRSTQLQQQKAMEGIM